MKVREMLEDTQAELEEERKAAIKGILKEKLKNVADCKKTLKKAEKYLNEFMESDIDEIETDEYEY